jgi:hypothetical protein
MEIGCRLLEENRKEKALFQPGRVGSLRAALMWYSHTQGGRGAWNPDLTGSWCSGDQAWDVHVRGKNVRRLSLQARTDYGARHAHYRKAGFHLP